MFVSPNSSPAASIRPLLCLRAFWFGSVVSALAGLLAGCGGGTSSPVASAPSLTLSTASLTFASTSVGATTAAQAVTLSAVGGAVNVSGITLTGANASSFVSSSNCPASLASGASCAVSVAFSPMAAGALSATLLIADNATGAPQTVALSGIAPPPAPVIALSSSNVSFGSQTIGAPAISQTVTVNNAGNAPLVFANVTLSGAGGPFMLGGTCAPGAPVAPGGACSLVLSYAPTTTGTQTATVTLADNATPNAQSISLSGTAFTGLPLVAKVLAGTLPVSGASVQLFAAGSTGNGSGATSLLSATLTSDATGSLTIPGQYNCPSATAQLYLVSRGGTVGSASAANSNLVLMSVLGACSQLAPGIVIVVNEATTVAAIVALAPFLSPGGMVGGSSTNAFGVGNAFASAAELVSPATGTMPGASLPGNVVAPLARVASLANLVNACAVSPSACAPIFAAATPPSGSAPSNTLDAVRNIVRNPASNVAALYAASQSSTAFQPALTAAPADWTFFLTVSGAGMNGPSGLGIDSLGNVWVASYFSVASKFTPLGAAVFPAGVTGDGLNNSYGLAMDRSDNAWIPNEKPYSAAGTGSVSEISPAGTSLAGPLGYTAGGMNYPTSVAIDPNGTAWVVDYGNSHLTLLNAMGTPLSGASGYTSPLFSFPVAVVVDGNHFGWIANQSSTNVTRVAPDGSSFTNFNCCNGASGLAIDQGNNVWVANYYGASVSLLSSAGTVVSNGYTGLGSLDHPQGLAIDGAGNVWVANYRKPYLTELAGMNATPGTSMTPGTGYGADAALLEAYAIAVDASGNLWISNFGSNTVTKFLGLATPVKTPLSGIPQLP